MFVLFSMNPNVFFPVLFFILFLFHTKAYPITDSTSVFVGSQLHYGFIIAHSRSLTEISRTNPFGFTLELSRIRHTQKAWNACNCLSQNGIAFSYFNFNNPAVLGESFNLFLFAEPQLVFGKINLSVRGGAGFSYLSRIYHPIDNPENLFFSRHLSGLLQAQINSRYWVSDNWTLRFGISYNHISNGGTRHPNKGMNFPVINAGLEYVLNPMTLKPRSKIPPVKTNIFYLGLFANSRSLYEDVRSERKPVAGLQAGFYYPVARMHAFGAAAEFLYDGARREKIRRGEESGNFYTVAPLFRHHLLFGRFDFSQAMGVYLIRPSDKAFFQRYALEYQLKRYLKGGFSLKAHGHVAEQMDLRIMIVL
ncbi:MAG: acyloxyacyl hydrolase [Cyclobacteriaceae bacterium]|nr:acyloxyacyl hydrolase [Cyclobacteriaceae bacterium]